MLLETSLRVFQSYPRLSRNLCPKVRVAYLFVWQDTMRLLSPVPLCDAGCAPRLVRTGTISTRTCGPLRTTGIRCRRGNGPHWAHRLSLREARKCDASG